jgi:4'-phosphopantetheinyl transferase
MPLTRMRQLIEMKLAIAPRQLHLWVLVATEPAAAQLELELSAEERRRGQRFVFEHDRLSFRCARGLARRALSAAAPAVAPRDWRFRTARYGKPEVLAPLPRLRFNVSHTRGLVACVVALDADCGVDVDRVDRRLDVALLADSVLTASERRALAELPPQARPARFFQHWTLKEAYTKARGLGMSLPFDQVEVDPTSSPKKLRLHRRDDDDPSAWQVDQEWLAPNHWLAVAVRRGSGPDYPVIRHTALEPL